MKKFVRWLWIAPLVALAYAGLTVWMRWQDNRGIEARARTDAAEADRRVLDSVGGGDLKVLSFYANPATLRPGQKGLLCYGVAGADSVGIVPSVGDIAPSLSRCVEIAPTTDIKYQLIVKGRGREEVADTIVRVR